MDSRRQSESERTQALYRLFPETIRKRIEGKEVDPACFQEIRLRVHRGAAFCDRGHVWWLMEQGGIRERQAGRYCLSAKDMECFLALCSEHSLYAFAGQMRNGYMTVQGGHRVGFAGSLITENGRIEGFREIGSVNLRIAHEVKGCGSGILRKLFEGGRYCSTLILSPPGCGKTTLLRDLIRLLSEGSVFGAPMNVAVSDERGELGACYRGCPEFDLGCNTDILDGGSKEENLWLMLRSLSPQVLAMDEIGSIREAEGLVTACRWGVGLLASMHGSMETKAVQRLGLEEVFERYIEPKPRADGWSYTVYDRDGRECM